MTTENPEPNNSLIDSFPHPHESSLGATFFLTIGIVSSLVFAVLNPYIAIIALGLILWLIFAVRSSNRKFAMNMKAKENTSDNIKNRLKEKYGVSVREEVCEFYYGTIKINRGLISATNVSGERIQVSIEFTDNQKDVLAFSSGAEMPILANPS